MFMSPGLEALERRVASEYIPVAAELVLY